MKVGRRRTGGRRDGLRFEKKRLEAAVEGLRGRVTFGAALRAYTSFKIGGPADALVEPADVIGLIQKIRRMIKQKAGVRLDLELKLVGEA